MARPKKNESGKDARQRIIEAYGRLALEKPLAQITVADVARAAACNRTTLYYHFETFDQVESVFLDTFFEAPPEQCLSVLGGQELQSAQRKAFDAMCTMLALNSAGEFRERIRRVAARRAYAALEASGVSDIQLDLRSELVADGALSVMAQRGKAGNDIDPRELAQALSGLLPATR